MESTTNLINVDVQNYFPVVDELPRFVSDDAERLFFAITGNHDIEEIIYLLNEKISINAPLIIGNLFNGWTALHFACYFNNIALVEFLLINCGADVNVTTEDAIEPIHLAVLRSHIHIVMYLLNYNSNVNAEISKYCFTQYRPNEVWFEDFGDTMTLVTFAVLYFDPNMAGLLMGNGANLKIKSIKNKTLLMYALEKGYIYLGNELICSLDAEYLNARDDDGYSSIHYLLHPKYFGRHREYRYYGEQLDVKIQAPRDLELSSLILGGADIHATVNGDPRTLILNVAAYRSSSMLLQRLLPSYDSITNSRALYYATLPFDFVESFCPYNMFDIRGELASLEKQRDESIKLILKDLISRQALGIPIPEEEKQLMNKLIGTDLNMKNYVQNFERNFIHGTLKSIIINYGDESINFYEVLSRIFNTRKMRSIANNKALIDVIRNTCLSTDLDLFYFQILFETRFIKVQKRIELLNGLRKIEKLRNAIPLPYELILETMEYLDNQELEIFIMAF